jgi:DNA-binding PadR family transcriptional regulator
MSLKFAILGILATTGPQAGYDIKTYFERGPSHVWQADLPHIYRTFDQLEQQGQVSAAADPTHSRGRKVYTLTEAGRHALQAWLASDFDPLAVREPNLVRLFFGKFIPPERLREQITAYRAEIESLLATYRQIEQLLQRETIRESEEAFFGKLTLDQGVMVSEALMRWCDHVLQRLDERQQSSTATPHE